ncbi:MAG: aldo/keto reductase [Candidatus Marinimicrobia bacterium]|nr:aldo/keto reductase [Candidatus Neomarinimicrobiota bacterium]
MTLNRRDFLKTGAATSIGLWLDTLLKPLSLLAGDIDRAFPQMVYRPYGQTGKEVSLLGFGAMRLPFEKGGGTGESVALLVKAYEMGVNYFDTAPKYVFDKSEEIVGLAMKEIDRRNKNVRHPLPYYWTSKSGVGIGDTKADDVLRRIEESLKRLGKDKIPFYHMWCLMDLNHYTEVMKKDGPYEGALKAKEQGLIEHIVFSSHATGEENLQIINDDVFEGMLVGYNVTNFPRQDKAIRRAAEKGMGVVTMNPLAGGLIPQNAEYFAERLKSSGTGMTIVQTALAFIMGQPEITVALSGMSKMEHLEENIKTLNFLKVFTETQLAELKSKYLQDLDGICTTCQYCDVCPEDIPVYRIMEVYNTFILKGKAEFQGYANWLKEHQELDFKAEIEKCIQCKLCEKNCTQHLNILERFDEITTKLL